MNAFVAYLRSLENAQLRQLLTISFGDRVAPHVESAFPVTKSAFDKLSARAIAEIEQETASLFGPAALAELQQYKRDDLPHYRREILRYGCTVMPEEVRQKTGMSNANPPPQVHSMIRSDVFAGDLYSVDMVVAAAMRAGCTFAAPNRYLDFGCSSGSVVRNLAAEVPAAEWHGCDPIPEAIDWAASHFPEIQFSKSGQEPPLPYADGYFNGVFAVSIWSHFSEPAAVRWFDEMHRVIAPGGFLIFTTHGYRSLMHGLLHGSSVADLGAVLADLIARQYAFRAIWREPSQEFGLQVTDWGMAFFTIEWLIKTVYRNFRVIDYQPGLNQTNQDIYVVARV